MDDSQKTNEMLIAENRRLMDRVAELQSMVDQIQGVETASAILSEREDLLREVYHQTNNSMATICNLLLLQSIRSSDEKIKLVLRSVETRIRTLALIQEKFYRSKDLSMLDYRLIFQQVCFQVYRSYNSEFSVVDFEFELEEYNNISPRMIIPCGLILNELVSNSLRYAFPDGRNGKIKVKLCPVEQEKILLAVIDDGVGMPEEFDFGTVNTLGLHLVRLLGEKQLGGKVQQENQSGTSWSIIFPASV